MTTRIFTDAEATAPVPMDEQDRIAEVVAAVIALPKSGPVDIEMYMDYRRACLELEHFYLERKEQSDSEDAFFNRARD